MYPSSDSELTYETAEEVYFFSGPFDPLNNFSAHIVQIWGQTFYTAEHAFQWKKFASSDAEVAERIKSSGSPAQAKRLARINKVKCQKNWRDERVGCMKPVVTAKVQQHEDVKKMLLKTGDKTIIENSPTDIFWGCGSDGTGENMMGKILMEVRASQ